MADTTDPEEIWARLTVRYRKRVISLRREMFQDDWRAPRQLRRLEEMGLAHRGVLPGRTVYVATALCRAVSDYGRKAGA